MPKPKLSKCFTDSMLNVKYVWKVISPSPVLQSNLLQVVSLVESKKDHSSDFVPLPPAVIFSQMFYKQLLHEQIPKTQKILSSCQYFYALSGSASIKAACKTLMKLTPVCLPQCADFTPA